MGKANHPPKYGYFPNPSKTWLVTKEGLCHFTASNFHSTGVNVTPDGRPYLRAAIGSPAFISNYVETKVAEWIANLHILGDILSQPHAAYSALTHGLMSKRTYLSRTIPDIAPMLRPLDETISSVVIPALTGRPPPGNQERSLVALPERLGGCHLHVPSNAAANEKHSSRLVTSTLQSHCFPKI